MGPHQGRCHVALGVLLRTIYSSNAPAIRTDRHIKHSERRHFGAGVVELAAGGLIDIEGRIEHRRFSLREGSLASQGEVALSNHQLRLLVRNANARREPRRESKVVAFDTIAEYHSSFSHFRFYD